ncbi:MAG: exopolysaccharide biosynthesis protein [Bdellovibrionota bacterium]
MDTRDQSREERFSTILTRIKSATETGDLTVGELVVLFGPRGHAFLIVFLVLPFLQPIPIPGVSTLLGLVMAMAGYLMMRNKPPWVPERLARVKIEKHFLLKVVGALESLLLRLERIVRPRGAILVTHQGFRIANGFLLCLHGLLMALPLPIPLSNFLPAAVLFLIALGSLEEDLAVVIAGYTVTLVNAAFFAALVLAPWIAAHRLDL